jgi:intraflagellar transport protein 74
VAVERPTTQQGLGGLKTAFKGPQRQVQDKSYFLGLLRTKMTELNSEMIRLVKGIDKNNKEMQNLPALENKVKEMAVEITGGNKTIKMFNCLETINYFFKNRFARASCRSEPFTREDSHE